MNIKKLEEYIKTNWKGLLLLGTYEKGAFSIIQTKFYLTLKEKDDPNGKASNIDRENVYRVILA